MDDNTLVIVTGAARGFGRALLVELLGRSVPVLAVCRSGIPDVAVDSPSAVVVADCARCDDLARVGSALAACRERYSNVVLINNAGYYVKSSFLGSDVVDGLATVESNVLAAVNMTRLVFDLLSLSSVVNIVSSSGLDYNVPRSDLRRKATYAGSKRFLARIADDLRAELPNSIRIMNLYPRNINTWSTESERDSMSPSELAHWVIGCVLTPMSWDIDKCVILPRR